MKQTKISSTVSTLDKQVPRPRFSESRLFEIILEDLKKLKLEFLNRINTL